MDDLGGGAELLGDGLAEGFELLGVAREGGAHGVGHVLPEGGVVLIEEAACHLVAEAVSALGAVGREEDGFVNGVDAGEFGDGGGVIVDAEVAVAVVEGAVAGVFFDDEQCGGLASAFVAAGGLTGGERGDEAIAQVAGRGFVGGGHGVDDLGAGEDVALDAVAESGFAAGPVGAFVAGEGCGAALRVDDAELAFGVAWVGVGELLDDVCWVKALLHEVEAAWSEGGVGPGLSGDGADIGFGPGDDGADGDEFGLDSDAPFAGLSVVRHD